MGVKVHRWSCPVHGTVHSFRSDSTEGGVGEVSSQIASQAIGDVFKRGCLEPVPTSRGPRQCGEHVSQSVHEVSPKASEEASP